MEPRYEYTAMGEQLERLMAVAKRYSLTVGEIIEQAIDYALANEEDPHAEDIRDR